MGNILFPITKSIDNKELDEYDVFHAKAPTQSRLQNGYEKFIIYTLSQICLD
jgi:hypothetical protein